MATSCAVASRRDRSGRAFPSCCSPASPIRWRSCAGSPRAPTTTSLSRTIPRACWRACGSSSNTPPTRSASCRRRWTSSCSARSSPFVRRRSRSSSCSCRATPTWCAPARSCAKPSSARASSPRPPRCCRPRSTRGRCSRTWRGSRCRASPTCAPRMSSRSTARVPASRSCMRSRAPPRSPATRRRSRMRSWTPWSPTCSRRWYRFRTRRRFAPSRRMKACSPRSAAGDRRS